MKPLLLFVLALVVLLSCHRHRTTVEGMVINAHTGEPVEGALVFLRFTGDNGYGSQTQDERHLESNAKGRFYFSEKCAHGVNIFETSANGFATKTGSGEIVDDDCNEILTELIPLDGNLKIEVCNVTGQQDSIFLSILNGCETWWYGFRTRKSAQFPLHLNIGEKYSEVFKSCKGGKTKISWRFERDLASQIFQDSVDIAFSDSTVFKLEY